MKVKIKFFIKLLSGGLLLMALSSFPTHALAYNLDVRNPYSQKMQIAIVDFEDQAGTWRCHGWFVINPLSSRRIQMPTSTQKKSIYLYAETSEAQWSGEGIPSSITRTIHDKAFKYYDGQAAPAGPNRRQALFVKYELEDELLYWSPE